MNKKEWTRREVEVIVDDYLSMLASELAGTPYNKTAHRRALVPRLDGRSEQSIEFKHTNISAVLVEAGFPYIDGYKPRSNYQALLAEVVAARMSGAARLHDLAAADADRLIAVPEVDDILAVLVARPKPAERAPVRAAEAPIVRLTTNYIEREARNRSLGSAGELFVLNYERARLVRYGNDRMDAKIEHTSQQRADPEGYPKLSYEESGAERLIEVKTTKYGVDTPFFVTRNEVATSDVRAHSYQLYRLFAFRTSPRLYQIPGSIGSTCELAAATYLARPR